MKSKKFEVEHIREAYFNLDLALYHSFLGLFTGYVISCVLSMTTLIFDKLVFDTNSFPTFFIVSFLVFGLIGLVVGWTDSSNYSTYVYHKVKE